MNSFCSRDNTGYESDDSSQLSGYTLASLVAPYNSQRFVVFLKVKNFPKGSNLRTWHLETHCACRDQEFGIYRTKQVYLIFANTGNGFESARVYQSSTPWPVGKKPSRFEVCSAWWRQRFIHPFPPQKYLDLWGRDGLREIGIVSFVCVILIGASLKAVLPSNLSVILVIRVDS